MTKKNLNLPHCLFDILHSYFACTSSVICKIWNHVSSNTTYLPPTIQFERMWQYNLMVENLLHADLYKRQECESPDWSFAHQFPSTTLLPQPVLTGLWCKVWWCDPKNQIPTNKTEEWRSVDSEFTEKFLFFKASKQFFQIWLTFCQMGVFKNLENRQIQKTIIVAQCGNFMVSLSLRFYVKSILEILEVQNLPF